ncbi:MAG: hypothetical protein PHF25_08240 [Candidatus Margulisbacteria bacterium]|nr:hypothetical protein [Candidatus Margulisiibacteriota bacterium]
MSQRKTLWKDRVEFLKDISSFIGRNGAFFNQNSNRMSDLFEMSVYSDILRYYTRKKFEIEVKNINKKNGAFHFKLSPAGIVDNFSYFIVNKKEGNTQLIYEVHHNTRVQSAHDEYIYFTADVSVCCLGGVTTVKQSNGKRNSYIENSMLVTFFEAKNMVPFPEIIFSFNGIVLEVTPKFIMKQILPIKNGNNLCPAIVFAGKENDHTTRIIQSIKTRYGINVITGLYATKGKIYSLKNLNEF